MLPVVYPVGTAYRLGKRAPKIFRRWRQQLSNDLRKGD
jgi:hypothetical protein